MSCEQNKRPNVRRQPLDSIVFDVFEKRYVLHYTLIIINKQVKYIYIYQYNITLLNHSKSISPISAGGHREFYDKKESPCILSAMTHHRRPPVARKRRLSQYFTANGYRRQVFSFQLDALTSVTPTIGPMHTTTAKRKCVVKKYSMHRRRSRDGLKDVYF